MKFTIANCKLCNRESNLKQSHIIPRSYIKRLKGETGQTIEIDLNGVERPKKKNFDPKSPILCEDCEQYLSTNFEKKTIEYFRNSQNYSNEYHVIVFKNFNFRITYLFYISILWRASVSGHKLFDKAVISVMDKYLKYAINQNSLITNENQRIHDFIRITMFKIIDTQKHIPDDFFNDIFINFFIEKHEGITSICFVLDGFGICFNLGDFRFKSRLVGQLHHRSYQVIPKISFEQWPMIRKIMEITAKQARNHPAP